MTRLYALGLDAYRLIFDVLPYPQRTVLEGATGRLTVNRALNRIDRVATVLQYRNGQLVSFG
jgi:outer membrane PBP1 activator LpoA protein